MKTKFLPLALLFVSATILNAEQNMDYKYVLSSGTGDWSTATWDVYQGNTSTKVDPTELGIGKYPDSKNYVMQLNWGTKQLNVDGEYTVGKITVNPSLGVTQGSDAIINLKETTSEWADGVINIDTSYIQMSPDTSTMRYGIYLNIGNEHSQAKWNSNPEAKLTISGGTINMGNSADSSIATGIRIWGTGSPSGDSALTSPLKKTLTFDADSTVNVASDLYFGASNAETILGVQNSCAYITYNLDGVFNVRTNSGTAEAPVYTYKDIKFDSNESTVVMGAHYNIGGVINAGKMTFATNAEINFNSGAVVTGSGQMKFSDWGKTYSTIVNINEGASITVTNIWMGDRTVMTIGGSLKTTSGSLYAYQNSQAVDTTILNLKSTASLDIATNIEIAQMLVNVEAGLSEGSLRVRGGSLRLDNTNAELILRSSNAFKKTENGSQKEMLIGVIRGKTQLSLYADQEFNYLNFENTTIASHTSKIDYMTLTLFIDAAVNEINFTSLAGGSLKLMDTTTYLSKNLVIDGFREHLIHFDSVNAADDLSLISSLDGDWVDFKYEEDNVNGGYWLSATLVPEPATFVAIFGALALGMAVWRKRSK